MKSQRNHNDVSADKPQPRAAVAVDIDARRTELTFDFFALPRQLRDMVYHYLWESAPRVAAYHYATNSGILAHYDGFILDEDHLDTWEKLQRTSRPDYSWRPNQNDGLPSWLRSNKSILKEGMAQFTRYAHWNLWPVCSWFQYHGYATTRKTIMALDEARSISIWRMPLRVQVCPRPRPRPRPSTVSLCHSTVYAGFCRADSLWIENLADFLRGDNKLGTLRLAFGYPYHPYVFSTVPSLKVEIRIDLEPLRKMISAQTHLQTLEFELFNFRDSLTPPMRRGILDDELVQELEKVVEQEMGTEIGKISDTRATHVNGGVLNGGQLLDRTLVFSKLTAGLTFMNLDHQPRGTASRRHIYSSASANTQR
jgi:hypothetical protein